jgi:hypothetical protein
VVVPTCTYRTCHVRKFRYPYSVLLYRTLCTTVGKYGTRYGTLTVHVGWHKWYRTVLKMRLQLRFTFLFYHDCCGSASPIRIRIRLSVLMHISIRIRILPQVLYMLENQNFLLPFFHSIGVLIVVPLGVRELIPIQNK